MIVFSVFGVPLSFGSSGVASARWPCLPLDCCSLMQQAGGRLHSNLCRVEHGAPCACRAAVSLSPFEARLCPA